MPKKGFWKKKPINRLLLQQFNSFAVATLFVPKGTITLEAKNTQALKKSLLLFQGLKLAQK